MATFSGLGGTSMSRAQVGGGGRLANGDARSSKPVSREPDRRSDTATSLRSLRRPDDATSFDRQTRPDASSREAQMQLLSTARMIGAPGEAGSPLAIVPSVTAESTAHQLVANQLLPTRGARRAQSPEESHPPPQDGEGEFSKMYRESVAQDKKLAQEKDREKSDAMNERWEKLESDRVARDVKALRTLVEEMNASQSELRRQLGNERAARLSLEQQVHASQQSLAVLERTVEKQAVELRVERQRGAAPSREQEHDSRKIAELTARVVDLDAALEEEREERARISSLVRDMSNSKRGLAERVDGLEQQLSRRKSDAEIERQVHSMQDECLSQVESMSRMLDEMASVATRVDDAEEKISRTVAEEQQRRADWETDQQRHRLEFERSMATLATNQHAVAVATLERRLDDNAAQAEAEQAEEHKAMAE
jgi:hypothetical protein